MYLILFLYKSFTLNALRGSQKQGEKRILITIGRLFPLCTGTSPQVRFEDQGNMRDRVFIAQCMVSLAFSSEFFKFERNSKISEGTMINS